MNTVPLWVTLLGFAAPLLTLAGSSVAYVVKIFMDRSQLNRERFFELMRILDSDAPLATKIAAAYHLRDFPEHRTFVIRFCSVVREQVRGPAAEAIIAELDATREFMELQ